MKPLVVIHSFWLASQTTPIFRTLAFGAIACRSVSSCASLLFHYLRLIGECPKNKGFLSLFKVPNSFPLLIASGLSVRVTTYFCLEAWARPTDVSRKGSKSAQPSVACREGIESNRVFQHVCSNDGITHRDAFCPWDGTILGSGFAHFLVGLNS